MEVLGASQTLVDLALLDYRAGNCAAMLQILIMSMFGMGFPRSGFAPKTAMLISCNAWHFSFSFLIQVVSKDSELM